MKINWFKDLNNIVFTEVDDFLEAYRRELKSVDLKNHIEEFRKSPVPEGKVILGENRISVRLFQPNCMFREELEKGENIWIYFGVNRPCYCLNDTAPRGDEACFFFSHKECEYYPCHTTSEPDSFNCLFCYCPLYCLGNRCGGNFIYFDGIKDCSKCMLPHQKNSYEYINSKFPDIVAEISKRDYGYNKTKSKVDNGSNQFVDI